MNKKLIAIAVASTFVVPVVAQADANWYGRINTAVAFTDADAGDSTDIKNISSRFGVKGSHDLGNGLETVYRYEFGVESSTADVQDDNRLSFVGLKGSFGTVTMGRVWSAAFNHVGTIMDVSNNVGGDSYNGAYRTSNTLSYSGGSGPLSLQVDLILDGANANSSGADGWGIGGTYSAGALSIAAAHTNTDADPDDTDYTGVAVKYSMENFWLGAGHTQTDDGTADDATGTALLAGGGSGDISWWVALENLEDDDTGTDTDTINFNITKSLSKNTRIYIEAALDDAAAGDTNELLFGLRTDF